MSGTAGEARPARGGLRAARCGAAAVGVGGGCDTRRVGETSGVDRWRSKVAAVLPPARARTHADLVDARAVPGAVAGTTIDETLLALVNAEIGQRLDGQRAVINELDTKAGSLVAAGIALVGYLLAEQGGALVVVALVAHAAVIATGLFALGVRRWHQAPTPELLVRTLTVPTAAAYTAIIRAKVDALHANGTSVGAKADWVKISTWLLVVAIVFTALSAARGE